jgi:hypothetical protein
MQKASVWTFPDEALSLFYVSLGREDWIWILKLPEWQNLENMIRSSSNT